MTDMTTHEETNEPRPGHPTIIIPLTAATWLGYGPDGNDQRGHGHPHPDGWTWDAHGNRVVRCSAPLDPSDPNLNICTDPNRDYFDVYKTDRRTDLSDWDPKDLKGWWRKSANVALPILRTTCSHCGQHARQQAEGVECSRIDGDSRFGYETYHTACLGTGDTIPDPWYCETCDAYDGGRGCPHFMADETRQPFPYDSIPTLQELLDAEQAWQDLNDRITALEDGVAELNIPALLDEMDACIKRSRLIL